MADYWKSQPKKFCDFCKCWISDNKPSRDFHENGKRHQESVKKRLDEIRKKSVEDDRNKNDASGYMEEMERAAMQKLREDLAADPSLASQYGVTIKNKQQEKVSTSSSSSSTSAHGTSSSSGVWQEAYSPEGYTYYYNTATNESRWELPDNAVQADTQEQQKPTADVKDVKSSSSQPESSSEQNSKESPAKSNADDASENKSTKDTEKVKKQKIKMTTKISKSETDSNTPPVGVTKKEKNNTKTEKTPTFRSPYGAWAEVKNEDETPVDYELPCNLQPAQPDKYSVAISEKPVEPKKIKFAEKTFSNLGDETNEPVEGFKKRKLNAGGVRNIRRARDEES